MAEFYASYNTGNDANPGTIVSPKQNIAGGSGLLSIPHGGGDQLWLARDSTWPQQQMFPSDGLAANHLFIGEYGSGSVRPTIDWQNSQPGINFAAVVSSGSYTDWQNLRIVNVGPESGHTDYGSRAFVSEFKDEVGFWNCEVDLVAEDGFYIARGSGTFYVQGCLVRRYVQRWLSGGAGSWGGVWGGGIGLNRAPDVGGSGSASLYDNVIDRGVGEALSAWQQRNTDVHGGLVFSARAVGVYANCVQNYFSERTIVYGTTDTTYHRVTGYVGAGLATACEVEGTSSGNDARAGSHGTIRRQLHLVAFCGTGISLDAANTNTQDPYPYNSDNNTLVDNAYSFSFATQNAACSGGSTIYNTAAYVYVGGAHGNATDDNVPSGLTMDYTMWVGSAGTVQAAFVGANDTASDADLFKTTGWQSMNDIDDLGSWTLADGLLVADNIAAQFDPQSLVTTVQALTTPALDWLGVAGLANPGALRYQDDAPPVATSQHIRVERHVVDFGSAADTSVLTFTQAGKNTASVWPHLRNVRLGSAGPSSGTSAQESLATLGVTISSITATSCTLTRHASGSNVDVRCYVEVWFYDGPAGGDNEFVVRWSGTVAVTDTNATATQAISGVGAAGDLVAESLGVTSNAAGGYAHFCRLYLGGGTTLTFERENSTGDITAAGIVVEMTGANWQVEEVTHTVTAWNTTETETISTITSWATAFVVSSLEAFDDEPNEIGWLVWPGASATEVRFRQDSAAGTGSLGVITAFVVRNPDMPVDHYDSVTGGSATFGTTTNPGAQTFTITAVPDIDYAGLVMTCTYDENTFDASPDGWFNYRLTDVDELEVWRSRGSLGTMEWAGQVIDFSEMVEAASSGGAPSGFGLLNYGW